MEQFKQQEVYPGRPKSSSFPVEDRGSIQGNLTGERRSIFANGELSGLNPVPIDPIINNGVSQTKKLAAQGVTALDSFRGAYGVNDDYWYPGSDWMPYGLDVLRTVAASEHFAKKYYSVSTVPKIKINQLSKGYLNAK